MQPVTLNGGMRMNSWFDILSLEAGSPEDEPGIKKATETVHQIIDEEVKSGIPSERIILGGFSQGGALALHSALHYPQPLGGVLAFSCWLPLHHNYLSGNLSSVQNKTVPVLQCHGDSDPLIPHKWGQMTADILSKFMPRTTFKTYRGLAHSSCKEEMDDAKAFINNVFNKEDGGERRAGN
ncbi:LYPLA1 [Cordylochernes scorpioides]|uniref:palmitoyl-protein hydrolase n=1 Tax=Cordylochernes scorpioides TaxID=51811 RepID=A0ABY6KZX2_9ARAC|nr:LYPLA1 [Cordylochernes scorpioides]